MISKKLLVELKIMGAPNVVLNFDYPISSVQHDLLFFKIHLIKNSQYFNTEI